MRLFTHLIGSAVGVLFRSFFTGLVTGIIGVGGVLGISYATNSQHWPPTFLGYVTAVVVGLLAAYAGAVTILLRSVTDTVIDGVKTVEKDVQKL